jgi:hypothetical protein
MIKRLSDFHPINEDAYLGGGNYTKPSELVEEWKKGGKIQLRGSLFPTGSDKINKQSPEYKTALEALKLINFTSPVVVEASSSWFGTEKGYDNVALAKRRRNNFIKAMKEDGVKQDLKEGSAVVGPRRTGNDTKNYPLDQSINLYVEGADVPVLKSTSSVDNTGTGIDPRIAKEKMVVIEPKEKLVARTFYIGESSVSKAIDAIHKLGGFFTKPQGFK